MAKRYRASVSRVLFPPLPICYLKEQCCYVHWQHFEEFDHPHLKGILADSPSLPDIRLPKTLTVSETILRVQLAVLAELYPGMVGANCEQSQSRLLQHPLP